MFNFGNAKSTQSTDAMRQAAALLERLRQYQLAFLLHKQAEIERVVAESGGGLAGEADDNHGEPDVEFDEFWD